MASLVPVSVAVTVPEPTMAGLNAGTGTGDRRVL